MHGRAGGGRQCAVGWRGWGSGLAALNSAHALSSTKDWGRVIPNLHDQRPVPQTRPGMRGRDGGSTRDCGTPYFGSRDAAVAVTHVGPSRADVKGLCRHKRGRCRRKQHAEHHPGHSSSSARSAPDVQAAVRASAVCREMAHTLICVAGLLRCGWSCVKHGEGKAAVSWKIEKKWTVVQLQRLRLYPSSCSETAHTLPGHRA